MRWFLALSLALIGAFGTTAQEGAEAELRISVPAGMLASVSFEPRPDGLRLDLPKGAVFPMDVVTATDGMIQSGAVEATDRGMSLDLTYGSAMLRRVGLESDAVVVQLARRINGANGTLGELTTDNSSYSLGPNDRLNITIHNHDELSGPLAVTREGFIIAPLIGEVRAAGLTTTQLADELTRQLGEQFIKNPQIDVEVEKYRSRWAMVNGEVRLPGQIFLSGGTRLSEALSEAQGFVESTGQTILISRGGPSGFQTIRIDRQAFEDGQENPELQHGDIITVKGVEWAFIQGEVRQPTRVRLEEGLSLLRAISLAGGLTDWANRKSIKILEGGGGDPVQYNLKAIQRGREDDPLIGAGDIIIVERRFF